jgi:hypothetical protein
LLDWPCSQRVRCQQFCYCLRTAEWWFHQSSWKKHSVGVGAVCHKWLWPMQCLLLFQFGDQSKSSKETPLVGGWHSGTKKKKKRNPLTKKKFQWWYLCERKWLNAGCQKHRKCINNSQVPWFIRVGKEFDYLR